MSQTAFDRSSQACEIKLNALDKFFYESITRLMCNPTFFLSGGIRLEGKYGREENAFRKSSARRSCSCLSAEKNKPYYDFLHAVITFYADLIFFVEVRL